MGARPVSQPGEAMYCCETNSPQTSGVSGTYFFLSEAGLLLVFTQEPTERGSISTQLPQSQEKEMNLRVSC